MILNHLLISLLSWLVGGIAGGGLGYACALALRGLFATRPASRRLSTLVPWRTVVMVLPLLAPFVPVLVGLGGVATLLVVVFFVFIFALPFTASMVAQRWFPAPLAARFVAGMRTLAVASVVATTLADLVTGGGGISVLIREGWRLTDRPLMLKSIGLVALLTLAFDLLVGVVQYALTAPATIQPPEQAETLSSEA